MSDTLLTLRDIHVSLGGVAILRGLTTEIPRGKITALIGLNGAGKTTLLRVLLKEVPYTGHVQFHCGHDHKQPFPQHTGYVPQRLQFDPNLPITVRELVALALQKRPLCLGIGRQTRLRVEGMLKGVWAEQLLDRSLAGLSGGELQRVLLALAMEPKPEVLLLDEPAAGIDFQRQNEFYELINQLNKQTGVTVLLVSHEMSVVSKYAHHVLCLTGGKIECQGRPETVVTPEMIARIFGADQRLYGHHGHDHGKGKPGKGAADAP